MSVCLWNTWKVEKNAICWDKTQHVVFYPNKGYFYCGHRDFCLFVLFFVCWLDFESEYICIWGVAVGGGGIPWLPAYYEEVDSMINDQQRERGGGGEVDSMINDEKKEKKKGERERERERDRERQRETERDRERQRQRQRETETETAKWERSSPAECRGWTSPTRARVQGKRELISKRRTPHEEDG